MFSIVSFGLRLAALALSLGLGAAQAHEGHDQGAAPAPAHGLPRGEASSATFEVVVVANGGRLTIYLDRFATNEPISGATIEVETPQGPVEAAAQPDGTYGVEAPWLPSSGHVDLVLSVAADGHADVVPVGFDMPSAESGPGEARGGVTFASDKALLDTMTGAAPWLMLAIGAALGLLVGRAGRRRALLALPVAAAATLLPGQGRAHESHDHNGPPTAMSGPAERAQRQPDGTIFVPKAVQRIFDLRTQLAQNGSLERAIELPGRIIPDPNASGYVQTALGGRLSPPPGGFPRLGAAVKAGDVLGYVTPPVQTVDVSDMRQRQGELDQQIAIVERRLARYEQLTMSGAISRTQLEDTRLELQGLKDRRLSLDRVRHAPETLVAPVSGIVAEGTPVAGQIAQTTQVILQIYDPGKLWVEALGFDAFDGVRNATALTADGKSLRLAFRGAGFASRSQSIPIHFAIEGDTGGVRTGQFVTVFVANGAARSGIAMPRAALVRAANGEAHVFEQLSAERFVPRLVRSEPLDGERIVILAGIEPGRRVVVQGAELLDHIR